MMRIFLIILMLIGAHAQAQVKLQNLPKPFCEVLAIDPVAKPIPCDQVMNELQRFSDMNRAHEDSVAAFLGQTVELIQSWYDLLAPLEGQPNQLPIGVFAPVDDGVKKMSQVVDCSYSNNALLSSELDRILTSLRDCSISGNVKQK